jgi:deoxyribonuclease-1
MTSPTADREGDEMNPKRLLSTLLMAGLFACLGACGPVDEPDWGPDAGVEEGLDASLPGSDAAVEPPDAAHADAGSKPAPDAAQPDAGEQVDSGPRPYEHIEWMRDKNLKDALYDLVKNHKSLDYDREAKSAMVAADGGFDVIDGRVECLYTGELFRPDQLDREGGFNMEHSWPKSKGAGSRPAESDLHHLFPTERTINSYRSSYPFGETDCVSSCRVSRGGSKLGHAPGTNQWVFQVRPERQGDIARAQFYFAIRYRRSISNDEEATLRRWNASDPPDDRERARNLAIERYQKNRNPFVERPDFVDRISDF